MGKKVFLVRHCSATGQEPTATLTTEGFKQAEALRRFFSEIEIDYMVASPFVRAVQSVMPVAQEKRLSVSKEERLSERVLSSKNLHNWLDKLRETYENENLVFEGGESSKVATIRIQNVIESLLFDSSYQNSIVATHGNILSLLLRTYQPDFGFEHWQRLSNPDVFLLELHSNHEITVNRVWGSYYQNT